MRFDWQKFWSLFLFMFGAIGAVVAIVAACDARGFRMFLWVIPGVVAMAAGMAILE